MSITLNRGAQFTAQYGNILERFGFEGNMSFAFSHKTDGQAARSIHTLEDMLIAYVIDFMGS